MAFVSGLVALLLFLLLIIFCVPVEVGIRVQNMDRLAARLTVKWFFGFLRREWLSFRELKRQDPETGFRPGRVRRQSRGDALKLFLAAVGQRGFSGALVKFLKRLFSAVIVREFRFDLHIGLGDPAETGTLLAWIIAPMALLGVYPSSRVRVKPEFSDSRCDFELKGDFRVVPLRVVVVCISFLLAPPTLRAARAAMMGAAR